jgi:hypothetical protein
MDWGEFFKPTWKKILVTTCLGIICIIFSAFIINLFNCACGNLCGEGQKSYTYPGSCDCVCLSKEEANRIELQFHLVIYLIILIISYMASCLIYIRSSLEK